MALLLSAACDYSQTSQSPQAKAIHLTTVSFSIFVGAAGPQPILEPSLLRCMMDLPLGSILPSLVQIDIFSLSLSLCALATPSQQYRAAEGQKQKVKKRSGNKVEVVGVSEEGR